MYNFSLLVRLDTKLVSAIVFILVFSAYYAGHFIRSRHERSGRVDKEKSLGALEGSMLGLLALLLSFTFSMSSSRYDRRLGVIIEETNAIGTAILRADLYPDSIRQEFRKDFRDYVENRIAFYKLGSDWKKVSETLDQAQQLHQSLWNRAAVLGKDPANFHRSSQMIPALNTMIDIVTTRTGAGMATVPDIIIYLLLMICITSAFMVGYAGVSKPDPVIVMSFSLMIALSIFMIIDLDRPRSGIITMDKANTQMEQLRGMFPENK
jgi:hypothetical protein